MKRYTVTDNIISIGIAILIGIAVISMAEAERNERHAVSVHETFPTWEKIPEDQEITVNTPINLTESSDEQSNKEPTIQPKYSNDEIMMMAAVVHHEAENQPYDGKRLVAAVILNRIDSEAFPDTVYDVLCQQNQFVNAQMLVDTTPNVTQEDVDAVTSEILMRSDDEVLFFCSAGYGYGKPMYQFGDHYFSTL